MNQLKIVQKAQKVSIVIDLCLLTEGGFVREAQTHTLWRVIVKTDGEVTLMTVNDGGAE